MSPPMPIVVRDADELPACSSQDRVSDDIVLAIAGYNAGPEAAAKWARSFPSEYDEFIESIPYRETRNYAKKVLRSYGEYMRLSGEDPSKLFRKARLTLIRENSAGI